MARKNQVQYVNFYTAGTAAYKYEPVQAPEKKASLPKPRRRKRIRVYVDPMAIVGACAAMVLMVMMFAGMVKLSRAQQEQAQMAAYVQSLQEENARLEQQYHAGYDPDEIYRIATAMGMIPVEEAEHIQVQVHVPVVEEEPTAWENFCVFLTGLFA